MSKTANKKSSNGAPVPPHRSRSDEFQLDTNADSVSKMRMSSISLKRNIMKLVTKTKNLASIDKSSASDCEIHYKLESSDVSSSSFPLQNRGPLRESIIIAHLPDDSSNRPRSISSISLDMSLMDESRLASNRWLANQSSLTFIQEQGNESTEVERSAVELKHDDEDTLKINSPPVQPQRIISPKTFELPQDDYGSLSGTLASNNGLSAVEQSIVSEHPPDKEGSRTVSMKKAGEDYLKNGKGFAPSVLPTKFNLNPNGFNETNNTVLEPDGSVHSFQPSVSSRRKTASSNASLFISSHVPGKWEDKILHIQNVTPSKPFRQSTKSTVTGLTDADDNASILSGYTFAS